MTAFLFQILLNTLVCVGYQKICDQAGECENHHVNCPSNEVCMVICSGMSNACTQIEVNCPYNYQCTLQCSGINSCIGATMNCNTGICNIACSNTQSCKSTIINGKNSQDLTINCQSSNACELATIYCSNADSTCEIDCTAASACKMAKIYGAKDRNLVVTCRENEACDRIMIDASMTTSFELSNCVDGSSTCMGITVYCPPTPSNVGTPQCVINGDGGLSGTSTYPLTFFALNGFTDIEFVTPDKTDNNYFGQMYCDLNYTSTCNISLNGWFCNENGNIRCNDPQPTINPTNNPTIYPTYIPTLNPTYMPSINPSFAPITSIPTTNTPTTINPTLYPTTMQPTTIQPTTIVPSNIPSLSPIKMQKQPSLYLSDVSTTMHVLVTDKQMQQTEFLNTNDESIKNNKNVIINSSFTIMLIMILSIILLCCLFIICCLKQLRKDKIRHKAYGVDIELNKTNIQTNMKHNKSRPNTFIDSGEDIKPDIQHTSEIYKSKEIMIGNDDEVINENSHENRMTNGSNINNNTCKQTIGNNEDIIIEGDDDLIIYKDDTDSDKEITKGQNDDIIAHSNQNNHAYIMESDSDDVNRNRLQTNGETAW